MRLELEPTLKEKVFELLTKKDASLDYKGRIEVCRKAWDLIPDDNKYNYSESGLIIYVILTFAIRNENREIISEWMEKLDCYEPEESRTDKTYYLKGKAAYVFGDYDKAREYLGIANKNSRGRCFEEGDEKYLKFLLEGK